MRYASFRDCLEKQTHCTDQHTLNFKPERVKGWTSEREGGREERREGGGVERDRVIECRGGRVRRVKYICAKSLLVCIAKS